MQIQYILHLNLSAVSPRSWIRRGLCISVHQNQQHSRMVIDCTGWNMFINRITIFTVTFKAGISERITYSCFNISQWQYPNMEKMFKAERVLIANGTCFYISINSLKISISYSIMAWQDSRYTNIKYVQDLKKSLMGLLLWTYLKKAINTAEKRYKII